jgi:hypothetical protein
MGFKPQPFFYVSEFWTHGLKPVPTATALTTPLAFGETETLSNIYLSRSSFRSDVPCGVSIRMMYTPLAGDIPGGGKNAL